MNEVFQRQSSVEKLLGVTHGESLSVDAGKIEWQECGSAGFKIKPLMENASGGLRTWLMKVEPGAFSALHAHDDIEQIYVIEGSFFDQDKTYGAGEYIVRAPGAMHTAGSDSGAVVLLFYSSPDGQATG